ncbi:MAG: hypothetical protein R3F39_13495 [Myxococcota bacterium]
MAWWRAWARRGRADRQGLRIAISWRETLLREEHLRPGQRFRVGTAAKNDATLTVAGLPAHHVLLDHDWRAGWRLHLLPQLDGSLARGGAIVPFAEFGSEERSLALGPLDWGTLQAGELSVLFQPGRAASPLRTRRFAALDERVVAAFCVAFLIEAGILVAAAFGGTAAPRDLTAGAGPLEESPPEIGSEIGSTACLTPALRTSGSTACLTPALRTSGSTACLTPALRTSGGDKCGLDGVSDPRITH